MKFTIPDIDPDIVNFDSVLDQFVSTLADKNDKNITKKLSLIVLKSYEMLLIKVDKLERQIVEQILQSFGGQARNALLGPS